MGHAAGLSRDRNFLAISKNGESYIFLFNLADGMDLLIKQIAKFATDPELSFSWHEAAILASSLKRLKNGVG